VRAQRRSFPFVQLYEQAEQVCSEINEIKLWMAGSAVDLPCVLLRFARSPVWHYRRHAIRGSCRETSRVHGGFHKKTTLQTPQSFLTFLSLGNPLRRHG